MTEQEMLQDALVAHKFLLSMYNQFGLECSNLPLRKQFIEQYAETSKHNFEIFQIMQEKGFYPIMTATTKEINKAIEMHTQMQDDLNSKLD